MTRDVPISVTRDNISPAAQARILDREIRDVCKSTEFDGSELNPLEEVLMNVKNCSFELPSSADVSLRERSMTRLTSWNGRSNQLSTIGSPTWTHTLTLILNGRIHCSIFDWLIGYITLSSHGNWETFSSYEWEDSDVHLCRRNGPYSLTITHHKSHVFDNRAINILFPEIGHSDRKHHLGDIYMPTPK